MIASGVIFAVCWLVGVLYMAYDSWSNGVADGFASRDPWAPSYKSSFRGLYVAGYRVGADALRIERLNRE